MGNTAHTSGYADVSGARIYWEETGNPDGVPVLYLHGGPGSSLGAGGYRSLYDPARFRTIGLDQRGCGRSTPAAQNDLVHLHLNTTQQLVSDIEAVRSELGISRWIVSGISWGSTLALAYALEHPGRVAGLALAAVTTTSRDEVDWIAGGVGRFCPGALAEFTAEARALPGERVVTAYARRLAGADRADARTAARSWERWEAAVAGLEPGTHPRIRLDAGELMSFALLVTHYWAHDGFLPGGKAILARVRELDGIPAHLIHGQKDMGSPVATAEKLHNRWPSSRLTVVEGEGHLGPRAWGMLSAAVAELAGKRQG